MKPRISEFASFMGLSSEENSPKRSPNCVLFWAKIKTMLVLGQAHHGLE